VVWQSCCQYRYRWPRAVPIVTSGPQHRTLLVKDGRRCENSGLTPVGATLRSDVPRSMRAWARLLVDETIQRPWEALADAVRTGELAFPRIFGTDAWTYRAQHPELSALFDQAMQSMTQGVNAGLITHYPFGDFRWIIDVGGGNGTLLITILEQNPAMSGTVFELPQVAVQARARVGAAGLASRCDVIEGNALVKVPHGADAYLLKSLVHGRDDDQTVTILRNCRSAMPAHGKLILIERHLPERIDPENEHWENFLQDISMMLLAGGRENAQRPNTGTCSSRRVCASTA